MTDGPFEEQIQALLNAIRMQAVLKKASLLAARSAEVRQAAEIELADVRIAAHEVPAIIQERLAELEAADTFKFSEG